MTWMPSYRRAPDDDEVDRIARGQDAAVDAVHMPPMPEEEDPLPGVPYSLDPIVTDDPSTQDTVPSTPFDEWVKKHPKGIDLGSNEAELTKLRAARDAVKKPKRRQVSVGRPDMPEGPPRPFADLSLSAPREDTGTGGSGVESATMDAKFAPATSGDRDMLDAELMSSGRRTREGLAQASRMIGRAGLSPNPQGAAQDAQNLAQADRPTQFLQSQRAETRKKAEDSRLEEDQGFQRSNEARAQETQGFNREKVGRERDYNSPTSGVSQRRRSELMGIYGKEVAKIPYADFQQLTAADVDVLMKELQQQKAISAGRQNAIDQRNFLHRLDALGKGSQSFGEVDQLEQTLESLAPGITTGKPGAGAEEMGGWDKAMLALPGGVGERFTSDKTAQLNRALDELTAQVGYLRSGKVITEAERQNLRRVLGLQMGQDPALLSRGVSQVLRELHQRQQQFQGGYGHDAGRVGGQTPLEAFEGQGGSTYRRHGDQRGGGGRIKVSNGKETMMIQAADEAEAAQDGFHRVP